jgi:dihydrofolate reductase
MATLVFGMNVSLDGFVDHDAFEPDPELFEYFIEQTRNTAGSIYGRGLYEVMRYWDGDDWDQHDPAQDELRDFAEAWRRMPKWVVSQSLTSVGPNATLISGDVEAAIRRVKSDVDGEIEVGGPRLAAHLSELGVIDEYHLFVHPVVLGRGSTFFHTSRPALRLIASDRIGDSALKLTYVPA